MSNRCGQEQLECRSLTLLAVNGNESAVTFHNAEVGRESQTGAFANFFGREKRIENLIDHCPWHSGSGIAHAQSNELTEPSLRRHGCEMLVDREILRPNYERAAVRHCIARI